MSTLSNLELLRRVPLFAMLTSVQAESVSEALVKRRFKRGELIVEQGKQSNALFIVLTGRARVLTSDARGREVIVETYIGGDGHRLLVINGELSAATRRTPGHVVGDGKSDIIELVEQVNSCLLYTSRCV